MYKRQIENEAMILDEGKFYTVIKAGFGTNEKDACVCKTLPEYRFGAVLIKRRDAVLKQYLLKEEKRVEGILKGFAGKSEEELTAGQAAACKALKEELSCIKMCIRDSSNLPADLHKPWNECSSVWYRTLLQPVRRYHYTSCRNHPVYRL